MHDENNISKIKIEDQKIIQNTELNIWEALIPVFALVGMLAYNIYVYGDDALSGSNQFILLLGAAVAAIVGFRNKVTYKSMLDEVAENIKSTTGALLILLMVGALAGTWLISGIIPTMIYYGLQILNPTIFLAACVIICSIISIATGSSWTTSATVGIALVGIGETLGISIGMTAGAVLSGAYFGDKMSPLSDTTNLAPAMAGGELFSHIKYMALTTIPTIVITLLIFIIIGFNLDTTGTPQIHDKLAAIDGAFNISPWLFIVPVIIIVMIFKKTPPLIALLLGALLGGVAALIAQPNIVADIAGAESLNFESAYGLFASTVASCLALNLTASDQYLALVVPGKMFKKAYEDRGLAPENLSRTLEDSGTVTSVLIPWNTCGAYHSKVLFGYAGATAYIPYAFFSILSPFMTLLFAAFAIKIKQLKATNAK